jgi:hypothetical protein
VTTKLGAIQNGAGAPAGRSKLAAMLAGGKRGETLEVPGLGRVRIELVGERASQEIEGDVYRELARLEIPLNAVTAERYELERAVRTLAVAVRDPDDHAQAFGTAKEWAELDNDLINSAWHAYGDVRLRLDPVSQPLDDDTRMLIAAAVKKKDDRLLRSFGTVLLSTWLASTDVQLSSSRKPSSSNSESSSESLSSDPTMETMTA